MATKRCPHCNGDSLWAKVIRAAKVQSLEDGTFSIVQESQKFEIEIVKCVDCKNEINLTDLVELVPCKTCNSLTSHSDLDENGICDICKAIEIRPEFANASKEDLIRMVLHLEHNTNKNLQKTENKIKEEVVPAIPEADKNTEREVDSSVSETVQDRMAAAKAAIDAVSAQAEEEQKPKKTVKRKVVKKNTNTNTEDDAVDNIPVEESNIKETTNKIPDNFINPPEGPEEAPFPQQEEALQNMFDNNSEQSSIQPSLPDGGFPLFPNEEESF